VNAHSYKIAKTRESTAGAALVLPGCECGWEGKSYRDALLYSAAGSLPGAYARHLETVLQEVIEILEGGANEAPTH